MLNLVAADLGASSGRVMLAEFDGRTLNLREVHRFTNRPSRVFDRMYWNIHHLLEEVKSGFSQAAKQYGEIRSLGIDTWGVDFGLIDSNGFLLDAPRHYRDPRNVSAMHDVIDKMGHWNLFSRSGIQIMSINTLYQLVALQQENPTLLGMADKLLLIPDLLNYFLTGEQRAEFTNATTTQLLDPQRKDWDRELISQLGLPTGLLPDIAITASILGPVRDGELLHIPSLRATEVIHTASHDTASAVISVPHKKGRYAYISSGTWSLVGTVVPTPVINPRTSEFNFSNEGGLGNFRLLRNVMGLWLVQETQRSLQSRGEQAAIQELVEQAAAAPAFAFVFDPDDSRLLQAGDIPDIICAICRETEQRPPENIGSLLRGIFESLALKYRLVLEQLASLTGDTFDAIHIVGGGAQNRLLSQFTANATQRPVITGPVEASALGNILTQLVAIRELQAPADIGDFVRGSVQTTTFEPRDKQVWDSAYERFCARWATF